MSDMEKGNRSKWSSWGFLLVFFLNTITRKCRRKTVRAGLFSKIRWPLAVCFLPRILCIKNIYVVARQEPDTLTGDLMGELIALNKVWELQVGKYSIECIILSILL